MHGGALAEWEAAHGWPPGEDQVVSVPDPPAGAGFLHTIPGAVVQRLLGVSFTFTAAGGGGVRTVEVLYLDPDGTPFGQILNPFTQASGVTATYTGAVGIQQVGAVGGTAFNFPLPPWRLDLVSGVQVSALALGAADTFTNCRLFVEQWPVRP